MQEISIGLQRVQPLACKENFLEAGARSRKLLEPSLSPLDPMAMPFSPSLTGVMGFSQFQFPPLAPTPLPRLAWANSVDLWRQMRAKDTTRATPETELRMRHPSILSNMRTILLDWMMEVRV